MTIKDLSALTGYSVGTISRVLNNQPNVSQKARAAILAAVEQSGFHLNANAKQLKQQRATSILAVVKGRSNGLFRGLVEAIGNQVAETDYPLIVDYVGEDDNEVRHAMRLCREKKPLGILFLGGNRGNFTADFHRIPQPAVLVAGDAAGLSFPNLSSVTVNDRLAAHAAIDYLVGLGHRRIAVIGGDRTTSDISRLRYGGCLEAFRGHRLEFDPAKDYRGVRFSYAHGYRAARELLEAGRDFTAIFAMADVMAIGAIRALGDLGLRVPEDVSVMGFDGLTIGEYFVPRLATISQPVEALAARSVEILRDCIEREGRAVHETVPFFLETRESAQHLGSKE